jgi:hypothetical protein
MTFSKGHLKMAEIIRLYDNLIDTENDLITSRPWEFRKARWKSSCFIQMSRADGLELNRLSGWPSEFPPHYTLKDSLADTILGVYTYRNNAERMKEVYYLAGLIDCLINQVNPLLRTFLINGIYKKISCLKGLLDVNWYGHIDQVLLPIDARFFNHEEYRRDISSCESIKALYAMIRQGTGKMFEILSREYLFFTPGEGA